MEHLGNISAFLKSGNDGDRTKNLSALSKLVSKLQAENVAATSLSKNTEEATKTARCVATVAGKACSETRVAGELYCKEHLPSTEALECKSDPKTGILGSARTTGKRRKTTEGVEDTFWSATER